MPKKRQFASERATVATCYSFGARALEWHITLTTVPERAPA